MSDMRAPRDGIIPPDVLEDDDEDLEPQVWHQYSLKFLINTVWDSDFITPAHLKAFDDGWDTLVVIEEWRRWSWDYLIPACPYLSLNVRDDLEKRLLRKTKSGVSMHLPARELLEAEAAGELVRFYAMLIRTIYAKWAQGTGCPAPPALPANS